MCAIAQLINGLGVFFYISLHFRFQEALILTTIQKNIVVKLLCKSPICPILVNFDEIIL